MEKPAVGDSLDALAARLQRVIDATDDSANSWAIRHGLSPRLVQRILKRVNAPSLDTLDAIAAAAGMDPWVMIRPPSKKDID